MKFSQSSTQSLILYYVKYTDIQWHFMTENHPRYCGNQKAKLLIDKDLQQLLFMYECIIIVCKY